jgi:hypothetical protein
MITRRALLASTAALLATPLKAETPRPFRMGVTRWPPAATYAALELVETFITNDCDMACPMVLGGVPWHGEYSKALLDELTWQPPAGHALALQIGALNIMRDGLSPLYAERDNQPLPPDFADAAFDDPKVIAAYRDFALRAAREMRPDWLFIGIEVNILLAKRPDVWPAYVALHRATYEAVKAEFPDLKVGFTIVAMHYLGLADNTDPAVQNAAMLDLAEFADIIGWSVYPHTSWEVELPLSPDWFRFIDDFAALSGKPAAVTESGMTDRRVWIGVLPLSGSPEAQAQVMEAMLTAAETGRWAFVVNWTSHDYPELLKLFPPEVRELGEIWVWTGLLGPNGEEKPVTKVWRDALARPYS